MSRFAFHEVSPALFNAQFALATALGQNPTIAPVLRDLIESRVSQINQCAYCVRMGLMQQNAVPLIGRNA